jgi:tetratricopeptide (TPR) repeat protein
MRRDEKWMRRLGMMERARELFENKESAQSRDLLLELRSDPDAPRSGHLSWRLAIVSDCMEDFEMALSYIEEAIATDPLAVPYHRSFDIIVDRIRDALTAKGRAVGDPTTPRLYRLLVGSSEANLACHIVMARYHASQGQYQEALKLLDAVTTLDPAAREAWVALAEVARAAGNEEMAKRADLEQQALADGRFAQLANTGEAQ